MQGFEGEETGCRVLRVKRRMRGFEGEEGGAVGVGFDTQSRAGEEALRRA
jgi:hypothetical protein